MILEVGTATVEGCTKARHATEISTRPDFLILTILTIKRLLTDHFTESATSTFQGLNSVTSQVLEKNPDFLQEKTQTVLEYFDKWRKLMKMEKTDFKNGEN